MNIRQIYQNSIIQEIKSKPLFDEETIRRWINIIKESLDDEFADNISKMRQEHSKILFDSIDKNEGKTIKVDSISLGGLNEYNR